MVEGARLESVYRGNSIEGSNPSLSAIYNKKKDLYDTKESFQSIPLRGSPRAIYLDSGGRRPLQDSKLTYRYKTLSSLCPERPFDSGHG